MRVGPYPWAARVSRLLAASQLGWCLWAVVLGACAWAKVGPCAARLVSPRRCCCCFIPIISAPCWAAAIGHSLDITRYSQYQLAYTLLPEFASIWLAFEFLTAMVFGPVGGGRAWQPMKSRWMPKPLLGAGAAPGLPRLVQGSAPPRVGVVILAALSQARNTAPRFPTRARYRRAGMTILDALEEADHDALLMIDADAGHSVAAVRGLAEAYAAAPADLIIGCDGASRRVATVLSRAALWFAFDAFLDDPLSGVWLCSRRFYRNVPLFSRADARALQMEWTIQAFDKDFLIRETRLPDAPRHADARPRSLGTGARVLRGLLVWSVRSRPLRTLGALGLALLLLGGWLGYAPLRDLGRKKHHVSPLRVMAAPVLLVAGLLGIQAGLLLDAAAYRRREDCQLRLRGSQRGSI